jgi:hypothetical protein
MMLLQKQIERSRNPKKVLSVFDVAVMVVNTLKVTGTSRVMHVVIPVYKAMIAGSWSKPPTGKKLVALLSQTGNGGVVLANFKRLYIL